LYIVYSLKREKLPGGREFFSFLTTANPLGRVTDLLGFNGMVHSFYVK
jgi:hypothetical protein